MRGRKRKRRRTTTATKTFNGVSGNRSIAVRNLLIIVRLTTTTVPTEPFPWPYTLLFLTLHPSLSSSLTPTFYNESGACGVVDVIGVCVCVWSLVRGISWFDITRVSDFMGKLLYMPTYLSVYLPACLFYLSVFLSTYLPVFLHACLSFHLSICLCICLSAYLSLSHIQTQVTKHRCQKAWSCVALCTRR